MSPWGIVQWFGSSTRHLLVDAAVPAISSDQSNCAVVCMLLFHWIRLLYCQGLANGGQFVKVIKLICSCVLHDSNFLFCNQCEVIGIIQREGCNHYCTLQPMVSWEKKNIDLIAFFSLSTWIAVMHQLQPIRLQTSFSCSHGRGPLWATRFVVLYCLSAISMMHISS